MHFNSNREYLQYMMSGGKSEDLRESEKKKREQPQEEKPKRGKKA